MDDKFKKEKIKAEKVQKKLKRVPVAPAAQTETEISKEVESLYEGVEKKQKPEVKGAVEEDLTENVLQLGKKRGAVKRCAKLIEKGYKALNQNKLNKATKIFSKLKLKYLKLPSIDKLAISNDLELFEKQIKQKYQLEMQADDESLLKEKLE